MNNIANIDKYCCGKYIDFFIRKKRKKKKKIKEFSKSFKFKDIKNQISIHIELIIFKIKSKCLIFQNRQCDKYQLDG